MQNFLNPILNEHILPGGVGDQDVLDTEASLSDETNNDIVMHMDRKVGKRLRFIN